MSDIEKAKAALKAHENASLVLCRGDDIIIKTGRGVSDLVKMYSGGQSFDGYSAADKIVGRAAASFFAVIGVSEVFGEVMSKKALPTLKENKIKYSFGELTDEIINREETGVCPMEAAADGKSAAAAANAVKEKFESLKKVSV